MDDRFVHIALLEQSVAQVVVGFRVVRVDFQRLLVMSHRFVHPALLEQNVAEVVVGNIIVRRAGERVSPQRFTVPPIRGLRRAQKIKAARMTVAPPPSTTRR